MSKKPTYEELEKRVSELEHTGYQCKQAESELKEIDKKFRIVTESIQDVFWISTPGITKMIYVSPGYEEIWKRDSQQLLNSPRSFTEIIHPDDLEKYLTFIESFHSAGKAYECEYRILPEPESTRWIRERGFPVSDEQDDKVLMTGVCTDITDIKKTEKALSQSEAKYRTLVNNIPDYVMRYDRQYRHVFANEKAISDTGRTVETYLGKTHREMAFPGHLCTLWENAINRVYETGAMQTEIFEWDSAVGKIILEWRVLPEFSEDGSISTVLGISHDITDIINADEALKESEERNRTILETLNDGVILQSASGEILTWNKGAEDIFGIPAKEAIGQTSEGRKWPTIRENGSKYEGKDHPSMRTLRTGKPCRSEIMGVQQPSGEICWISINTNPIFEKNQVDPSAVAISFSDITKFKTSEARRLESENRFRSFLRRFPGLIYLKDKEGKMIFANEAWEKLWNFDYGQWYQKTNEEMFEPELARRFTEDDQKALDNEEGIEFEFTTRTKDGPKNWITRKFPVGDDMLGAISLDTTERKTLEKQLSQAQRMESIGNLAGGIAHDFNNILASIIGFTELALDETHKGTTLEDNLQEVYSAGKRAKALVKQILEFARQAEEKRSPIQPSIIIKEVLHFIRSTIPATIEICQEIESDSPVMANTTQVHQVLMNLCTNAADAMEDSGGVLTVCLKDKCLEKKDLLRGMRPGNYIEIIVSDTGVGISPEVIASIFDPYFTTKDPGEGTGLGMAVVHGIVESYGGKITVESEVSKGTTFKIYLPVTEKRSPDYSYITEDLPTGIERILFVDDEAPIAKMVGQTLKRLGYSVTTRTSSIEALKLFQAKPDDFDLVLTDMTMPNLTGDKLAVELMKIRADIPVILCTGYSKKISDELAADIGIKAFAYKPMLKADLAKKVRKVLDEATGIEK